MCAIHIREKYGKQFYTLVKIKNFFLYILMLVIIIVMIYYVGKAETNLISWIFFILNCLLFAFMLRSDYTIPKMKPIVTVAKVLTIYSVVILFSDILFMSIVGENPKLNPK